MDPIVAALPKDHPLAAHFTSQPPSSHRTSTADPDAPDASAVGSVITGPVLAPEALAGERFVMCERGVTPALFDSILAMCFAAGFSPSIVNSSSTWSGVLTLVALGEGIALVPSGVRHLRMPGIVFADLGPQTASVGISVAWNPENEGPIQRDFLRLVHENKDRIQKSGGN